MCNELNMQKMFYMYKIIQESLRFWIPCCGFQLKDSGFLVSVTWIVDSLIPNPRIPDSTRKKFPDSGFHGQKFPRFWNLDNISQGKRY